MKKTELIGVRMPENIKDVIQRLADEDKRTLSWMARELMVEALEQRGLLMRKASGNNAKKTKRGK